MAYVKLDDRYPDHPKVVAAGPDAAYLYICGLCYCNRYLTDGFIPSEIVPRLTPFDEAKSQQLATTLVSVCLWHVSSKNGFDVHDYLEHQSSKSSVLVVRAVRQAVGRLGGLAKAKQIAKQKSSKSPSKSLAKEEVRSKEERRKERTPLTEEFRLQMIERFGDMLSSEGVNEAINDALSHKAVDKWKNTERYVQNWLRKEVERHGNNTRQPTARTPPPVSGEFAKYQ